MTKFTKIITGIALASLVGLLLSTSRRRKAKDRSAQVADEGYETAYDILFPQDVYGRKKQQPIYK